jgi:hypothetical protein
VPSELHGQFFAGDSYVVQYSYTGRTGPAHIIYFWLGRESSTFEQGAAAARTKELADKLRSNVTQVRVVQGKEPPHFCTVFGGRMIVHSSGSGAAGSDDSVTHLFHIKGTSPQNTKAVEGTLSFCPWVDAVLRFVSWLCLMRCVQCLSPRRP